MQGLKSKKLRVLKCIFMHFKKQLIAGFPTEGGS